ncbi:sarcosine oxidase subunit alpha family protein [Rhodobacteraceae bacterium B1Z28]|uniref:Sarcosine oxidase subunit alpha family protein n=1 Tax=Ruegeria haliotis TaxID=2747601 RepID=A0ABX2PPL8_9RHOB|nr:sarcosine oxidase subunit alpha family protein [Ruegeria haliotis]NVO56067.1 sarcosine oxidase subunit alpha family protein [Ruegeria haliotis]
MSATRLTKGGRIDRSRTLKLTWDGKSYDGFVGDTLASALMASGTQILGRSFKYHRPRGVMSAGVEESGAIVTLGTGVRAEPNTKATMQELFDGLSAHGQNAWPNVRNDVGSVLGLFGRFFSAGFYYKTFMGLPPFEWGRGTGIWMQYEKLIRKAAGMGEASRLADPDAYDHAHAFCDVLVVGSGPAGLNAALTAAQQGKDVILVEQDFELGGDFLNQTDPAAEARRIELITALQAAGVRIMTRTTAFGLYDYGTAGLLERVTDHLALKPEHSPRQRFWTVRAGATVLATGALERMVCFADNDRPGVMTAAAARSYLNRFGVLPGQNIVVTTNNDSAYATAAELAVAGASVTLVDLRPEGGGSLSEVMADASVAVRTGLAPLRACGRRAVNGVQLARAEGNSWATADTLPCDLLLVSGGWSPVVNLLSHRGAKPKWDADLACFLPAPCPDNVVMAGSASGIWQGDACEASGIAAAKTALGQAVEGPVPGGWDTPIKPVYEVGLPDQKTKGFVDPQHDVTSSDVRLAHQEGFVSVEHLKRYTTLGMATDQGKMGNVIGLALMAEALGKEIPNVGTTRFRPPYTPVAIGALAGRNVGDHFRTLRRTPMHDWNLRHGATMTDAGLWHRPWYYARAGETITEAYIREAATVRQAIGICDVSSLGKIAVQGPDASEFLNRVYSNAFAKLPIGKARYGIMLRDDGIVMDDGTTWRLSETDFLLTTTTANAGKVMVWLEELLQLRWPDLKVHVSSVSDQWAGVSVAGPKARDGIAACLEDPDAILAENLPFMGVTRTRLNGGIDCLIARISFSGELAYEVYVSAGYGERMMDLLWAAAEPLEGCLYGLEALGALRIEKGHVTGAELDGRVTIDDAGLGKMASTKKPFIGSALRQRPELLRPDRPQLVGIFPKDRSQTFNGGALLCKPGVTEGHGEGWVTAVTHSPALGHWIGIGYISGGHGDWQGKTAIATDPVRKGDIEVEIVSPHMFDPEGERMHG